jgi:hypothetical protein
MTRLLMLLSLVAAALGLVAPAEARVQKVSWTATVVAGSEALLTVSVTPRGRCRITVEYATGVSKARGLGAKRGGRITWRWKVGSNTTNGRSPVTVDCGKSGKLSLKLRVRGGS